MDYVINMPISAGLLSCHLIITTYNYGIEKHLMVTNDTHSDATIAIISSNAFDFAGADIRVSHPAGKDLAEFILNRFNANGARQLSDPVAGEEGWTFDVELDSNSYQLFVHWAPIGNPPVNRWVIQPDIRKTLLRTLFGRRTAEHEVQPIVLKLRHLLDSADIIDEVNWVTQKEFASIY